MFNSRNDQDKPDFLSPAMIQEMASSRAQSAIGIVSNSAIQTTSDTTWTLRSKHTSLADHIEQRVCRMQSDLDRIKRIKSQIATGGILGVPMDDLRFVMNF